MEMLIMPDGTLRCLYGEAIDLTALGSLQIQRGSHVEPDAAGQWWVDLAPASGPKLGPYTRRSQALDAERAWLETHWLLPPSSMKGGCSCVT